MNRIVLKGIVLIGLLIGTGSVAQASDGWWTNAAGGTWSTVANWSNSIPNNGHANLTLGGANYSVAYDSVQPSISNLVVRNSAGYQTTLNMSAAISHAGGAITLSTGAVVNVTNGTMWTYGGTIPDGTTPLLDVSQGGDLEVCGGSVQFTNVQRSVGNTWMKPTFMIGNASTGTLRVTAGVMNAYTRNTGASDLHEMYVGYGAGGYGTLEVAGGSSLALGRNSGDKILYVGLEGGRGKAIIAGDLVFTNQTEFRVGTVASSVHGAYGEMIVTNGGRLLTASNMGAGKPKVGIDGRCYGVLRLAGTNTMSDGTGGWAALYAGDCENIAGSSTGVVELSSGAIKVWGNVDVGLAQNANMNTIGNLNISGGQATFATIYDIWIGVAGGGASAQGTLNMTGGSLLISGGGGGSGTLVYPPGSASTTPAYGYSVAGLIIGQCGTGNGYTDDSNPGSSANGTLNLSGGAITNQYQLVVGCNGGTGVVNQTGGTFTHVTGGGSADITNTTTIIGYSYGTNSNPRGGVGTYNLTGGSYLTPRRVFVGGVSSNKLWYTRGGSVGVLNVKGGSFTVRNTLYIGENGTGTVIVGSNGVLTVSDLVATNATSKIRFESGTTRYGTFTVTNNLTIGPNTKLEVDLTGLTPSSLLKLIDCHTRTGSFDPANITITGGAGTIDQGVDASIYLRQTVGTVIFVR